MREQQEKQNKVTAGLYSLAVHTVVFILVFFVVSWKAPDPPLGQLGDGLALGFDDSGTGTVEPQDRVGVPDPQPQQETAAQQEVKPEETKVEETTTKPTETSPDKNVVTAEDKESDVTLKTKKEEVRPKEKPPVEKVIEKPAENPVAVYKPTSSNDGKTNADNRVGKPGNQGKDENGNGDKGRPGGDPDGNAIYGKPGKGNGGEGGSSLEISGWDWDAKPNPRMPSGESGRAVFEIKVDENGEVISITTLQRSISVEAEQACRRSIQQLTFSKTGSSVPEVTTGKITFVIQSK